MITFVKSDIWSLGVAIWEIFSLGAMPYVGLSNMEVIEFVEGGRHLLKPAHCPDPVWEVVQACWKHNPHDRPSLDQIHSTFVQQSNWEV